MDTYRRSSVLPDLSRPNLHKFSSFSNCQFNVTKQHLLEIFTFHYQLLALALLQGGENDEDWSILVDSGDQGLQRLAWAILPHKQRPDRIFTRAHREHNQRLARHRVVCEQFYGSLKSKWRIMASNLTLIETAMSKLQSSAFPFLFSGRSYPTPASLVPPYGD